MSCVQVTFIGSIIAPLARRYKGLIFNENAFFSSVACGLMYAVNYNLKRPLEHHPHWTRVSCKSGDSSYTRSRVLDRARLNFAPSWIDFVIVEHKGQFIGTRFLY